MRRSRLINTADLYEISFARDVMACKRTPCVTISKTLLVSLLNPFLIVIKAKIFGLKLGGFLGLLEVNRRLTEG